MIAAIYVRRSHDQNISEEDKSIVRQLAHARAFAERKGWTIAEGHVYTDDP